MQRNASSPPFAVWLNNILRSTRIAASCTVQTAQQTIKVSSREKTRTARCSRVRPVNWATRRQLNKRARALIYDMLQVAQRLYLILRTLISLLSCGLKFMNYFGCMYYMVLL